MVQRITPTNLFRSFLFALLLLTLPTALYAASGTLSPSVMPVGPTPANDAELAAQLEAPFTVQLGQWALIGDATDKVEVQLVDLVSDSRCPAGVNCVVAGEARFTLNLRVDDVTVVQEAEIGQMPIQDGNKLRYDLYEVELLKVEPPAPAPNKRLRPDQYEVTLVVHQDGSQQPPATPTATPLPIPTATPLVPGDEPVLLGQPFLLRVGEGVTVANSDLSVTLRSLSDDSGCFSKDDCSTMTANGSLALRNGEDRELASFMVSFDPDSPFVYEFSGYEVVLTHVEQDENGEPVATFVVRIKGVKLPFDIPAAEPVDQCQYLSRFDAMAILQEETVTTPMGNFILGPLNEHTPKLNGLCGYGSIAWTEDKEIDPNVPYLLTSYPSDHLVVAGLLKGTNADELLPLIEASRLANPEGDEMDVLRIQTQLIAGQYEEIIRTIVNNAKVSDWMQVTPLDGLGNEAIWLWQKTNHGHFATVLVRSNDKFAWVSALVGSDAQELTVLDYMTVIARRMIFPNRSLNPTATPDLPQPTPTPDQPTGQGCDLLSMSDAAAILGEELYAQPVTQDESCGYVPLTELSPDDPDFSLAQTDYGVILGQLNRDDTIAHLESLVDALGDQNPQADSDMLSLVKTLLSVGDLKGALTLLPEVAADLEEMQVETLSKVNDSTLLITGQDSGHVVVSVTMLNDQDKAFVLYASLREEKLPTKSKNALIALFQQLAQQQ